MIDWVTERIAYHVEALRKFGQDEHGAITRLPFTKENKLAENYLIDAMEQCGLTVQTDCVGNIYGFYAHNIEGRQYMAIGSHYDSVIDGGAYDGIVGVVVGLVLAEYFYKEQIHFNKNFVLIAFNDEEGVRFGTGLFGSKTFLGHTTLADLHAFKDREGVSIYQAIKAYGNNPEEINQRPLSKEQIARFLEVHIEQGPVLEKQNKEIGIVYTISGLQRYMITLRGKSNHSGTTPMSMRLDPTLSACQVISSMIEKAQALGDNTTTTVGFLQACPGAVNIIPEKIEFSVDMRSVEKDNLVAMEASMRENVAQVCTQNSIQFDIEKKLEMDSVAMDKDFTQDLYAISQGEKYDTMMMPSGAGHDALPIGMERDTALIFVPSHNGCSHCKEEYTPVSSVVKAYMVVKKYFETHLTKEC